MEMEEELEAEFVDFEVQLMGIDQVILYSIDKCGQCIYCISVYVNIWDLYILL